MQAASGGVQETFQNGMFFKCVLLDNKVSEGVSKGQITEGNNPDRRNCLYWNPNMKFNNLPQKQYSFSLSNIPGKYMVVVQGVTESGDEILVSKKQIVVEQ